MSPLTLASARALRRRLLTWYRKNRRSLPWRQTKDPYAIWVSEAMLQQTQVATVIPYYQRFLRRFPTLKTLAKAPVTEVLDQWSGLGYYSRAKNLHAGAQEVVRRLGGKMPDQEPALRKLPGIGRYTAGAIASIAFDRPAPVVDGNVVRVLCRLRGIHGDPRTGKIQEKLWRIAEMLVPGEAPGDFNQALMELGATLCTSRNPGCGRCPVSHACVARKENLQEQIPPPKINAPRRKIQVLCGILEKGNSFLLARRPLTGLLPGLWEFPGGEPSSPGEPEKEALARLIRQRTGLQAEPAGPPRTARQTLSHREIEIRAYPCRWKGRIRAGGGYTELRWFPKSKLASAPLTAGMRQLAQEISAGVLDPI